VVNTRPKHNYNGQLFEKAVAEDLCAAENTILRRVYREPCLAMGQGR
jgi:hypothetical protein